MLAQTLLHILGAEGESLGMSRLLKTNTVKSRVHSLYRQGQTYLQLLQAMPQTQSEKLLRRFLELLLQHAKTSKPIALVYPSPESIDSVRRRKEGGRGTSCCKV